ncbi:GntR family transcriptional regulator [Agarivorans sp. MS3-6]|uniref:GntR family transcriptional regulator n=1 Tax=Agarivorans sp. TSD2052 TaxID=2937286 RepID=UPI00200E34F6|nr:GntR family transcriptional regulator [Agarivorans sp. TSD2052]UPW18218.1 GntR family transcriptional regulator [Agarivorans sp. TSD2052]
MTNNKTSDTAEEEMIVERIYQTIIDQRLAPGTKLAESELCEAFGVGRMRVRRALLMLANRELVVLHANKGAFVASPTAKQAHDVFETRLAIEPSLIRLAVQRATAKDIDGLEQHLQQESDAHHAGDRRKAITLSGQFHISLAKIADNAVMLRLVKDLVTQSSLIIAMFGSVGMSNCRDDEHARIIQAIRQGDEDLAVSLMREHIHHIKANINLDHRQEGTPDLASIFSS